MNPFTPTSQTAAWRRVGLASAFPDIGTDNEGCQITASCKAFTIPKTSGPAEPKSLVQADLDQPKEWKDQVLIFKYKGKFHAIDHQCPHSSYPLSQGSLFDIEDFGVTLSAGLTCPKHGWSFDLFSGRADRGNYKLKIWEVQLRDCASATEGGPDSSDQEVWVRRKPRIG